MWYLNATVFHNHYSLFISFTFLSGQTKVCTYSKVFVAMKACMRFKIYENNSWKFLFLLSEHDIWNESVRIEIWMQCLFMALYLSKIQPKVYFYLYINYFLGPNTNLLHSRTVGRNT